MHSYRRITELDALRGLAILLMVTFHLVFDLTEMHSFSIPYTHGFWYFVGKASAILFIIVAGIASCLGKAVFRHGIKLIAWGMLITLVTYVYDPETFVRFGILHFLGTSLLLSRYLSHWSNWLLAAGSAMILIISYFIRSLAVPDLLGIILGSPPLGFRSIDYYPLFPWYAVFLAGILAEKALYTTRRPLFTTPAWLAPLCWLGRHSLLIYLIHQPILLLLLQLWFNSHTPFFP